MNIDASFPEVNATRVHHHEAFARHPTTRSRHHLKVYLIASSAEIEGQR
ncbi:MAG: hypothetical protein VX346_27860 [Planctomycetota bacterium]|nr:hypothetical protein [Planctomycetota bacterium]